MAIKTLRLHELNTNTFCRMAIIFGLVSGILAGITEAVKAFPTEPGWALVNLISVPVISVAAMWFSTWLTCTLVNRVLQNHSDALTFSVDEL